jgi:hypothetical protein
MRKIDSLISDVLDNFQMDDYQKRNRVLLLWENIVGLELASLVKPVGFENSTLLLKVLHPAALMEISLKKNEILLGLNSVWKEKLFTDLRTV